MKSRFLPLTALAFVAAAAPTFADFDVDAKAREVAKSLVIVEYTLRNENGSREESGQGIVVHKDGIVMISGGMIPDALPKEYIKDIKIRQPGKNFHPVNATLLGRTKSRLFVYLKAEKPLEAPAFEPKDAAATKLGQDVFSVALTPKSAGYDIYVGPSQVRAVTELTHTFATTASFGLTRANSPVFDAKTGAFLGLVFPPLGEGMVLRDNTGSRRVELTDEDQASSYLVWDDIQYVFNDIPTKTFETRRAWLGIDQTAGLEENVRELYKIDEIAGVTIGSTIQGEAADKAGLLARDIILGIDGKPFSKSVVPEMMVSHFQRQIDKRNPGDKMKLDILRDGKDRKTIEVTLTPTPKQASEMPHIHSARIGVTSRDLVFADAYNRKLPQDTKGVMVALVKNGSPASLGTTPLRSGYLITKVNDQPVENQKQFLDLLKKEETDNADAKEMVFLVILQSGETQVCRIDLTK